jgi:hypothetical protein
VLIIKRLAEDVMDNTVSIVLKWMLLVSLSAAASFVAALLSGYDSLMKVFAMLSGILTFVIIYTVVEIWAEKRQMKDFMRSLKFGVIVKLALQLIPAIEIFTGMFVAWLVEMVSVESVFFNTYLMTIGTGMLLSFIVLLIASVHSYVKSRRLKLNPSIVNAQI